MCRNVKKNQARLMAYQAAKKLQAAIESKLEKTIEKILLPRPSRVVKATFKVNLRDIILWRLDMEKVAKAYDDMRKKVERIAYKDTNIWGNKIHARQKLRGESVALI